MRSLPFKLEDTLAPISMAHPLGCDAFGRDLLHVSMIASLESLRFAMAATLLSLLIGIMTGTTIGILNPSQKKGALFLLDLVSSLPFILVALALAAVMGPGYSSLLISLALSTLPSIIRLSYLRTIELRSEPYVTASIALGAARPHLVVTHLLPGLASVIAAKTPGLFAQALLAEASLSFIGVGTPIGSDSLGTLIATGKNYLIEAPQIMIAGAMPLAFTVVVLQFFSERFLES